MQTSFLLSCCSHVCMSWCLCIQVVSLFLFFIQQAVTPFKTNGKTLTYSKVSLKSWSQSTNSILFLTELFCKHIHSGSWPQRLRVCYLGEQLYSFGCHFLYVLTYLLEAACTNLKKKKKKKRFRKVSVTVHKIL